MVPPPLQRHIKITMQSKYQPGRCSSRLRFIIKDDLGLHKLLGRPLAPITFPRPFDPKMRPPRTPLVSMILIVDDQLYVYLLSQYFVYVKRI